jgi:hypothetical protein
MNMRTKLIATAGLAAALGMGTSAYAAGTVTATYFTLAPDNPDVGTHNYGPGNAVTDTLGPDGLPVEKSAGL